MPLITRIARLFQADMNAVLDKIEEPECTLKQAIREMQELLDADKRYIKLQEYELKQLGSTLNKKETELSDSIEELQQQLQVCFESKKDELARSLIKRKLEAEQMIASLSTKETTHKETLDQIKANYEEQCSQLENMQQKAEILTNDDLDTSNQGSSSSNITDDDIDIALLHEKAKWSAS